MWEQEKKKQKKSTPGKGALGVPDTLKVEGVSDVLKEIDEALEAATKERQEREEAEYNRYRNCGC